MSTDDRLRELLGLRVWKDGQLVESGEAVVSIWDHGFLYGDGVFEGIRIREHRAYRLHDHLARLRRSSKAVSIELSYSNVEIKQAIAETTRSNDLADAHVRVVLTRGVGIPGLDPRGAPKSSLFVMAYPFPPTLGTSPVSILISSVVCKAPRSVDAGVKSLNYLDGILARLQAIAAGASEAVLLDGEGFVAEATGSNVFAVRDGWLETPECTAALAGITRRTILELAEENEVPVRVRRMTPGELYVADEAFLTGTGSGIVPIAQVDGRSLPAAPGPVTARLDQWYRDTWLSPEYSVSLEPAPT